MDLGVVESGEGDLRAAAKWSYRKTGKGFPKVAAGGYNFLAGISLVNLPYSLRRTPIRAAIC